VIIIKGKAQWAKVFEPDTRFVPEGEYSTQVIIPEAEAAAVCEQLDGIIQSKFQEAVKDNPKLKAVLSTATPYSKEVDDNGDETGNLVFKSKLKARIKSKAGETYTQKPSVVDAKKTPMDKSIAVGNGSTVKIAVEPFPYVMQSTKQVGVSLRLKAMQVIDLVEYGAPSSIFDEEDGYVAQAVAKDNSNDMFDDEPTASDADDEGDF